MINFLLGISITFNVIFAFVIYLFFRYTRGKRNRENNKRFYKDDVVDEIDNLKLDLDFWE